MTVYIVTLCSDGETSHIHKAFNLKSEARSYFRRMKKDFEDGLKRGEDWAIDSTERFQFDFEDYLRKATVNNVNQLIKLINDL